MSYITKVAFRGYAEISEEREFIVTCIGGKDGGEPYVSSAPEPGKFDDTERVLGPVAWGKELVCPECNSVCAEREIVQHTHNWMFTVFPCPNHPKIFFLDIFPKMEIGTTWDSTNAFAADIDPVSNPDTPEGITINNRLGQENIMKRVEKD